MVMLRFALYLSVCIMVWACGRPEPADPPVDQPAEAEAAPPAELTDRLTAGASPEMIAEHLLEAERSATPTRALSMHYADMDRETAYAVQFMALGKEISQGKHLVGWKMGGTRVVDPAVPPDPSFAYMLNTDSLANGQRMHPDVYVGDSVLVEAEIAFVMGRDVTEPVSSRSELTAAIESVAGGIELISIRLQPVAGGEPPSTNLMIAARLSHAGVMLGDERLNVSDIDFAAERAVVEIDGVEMASGAGSQIMNSDPLDALMWLANELPRHGLFLRAGDIVITGSLYDNPTLKPGQTAVVRFTSLGDMSVSFTE